MVDEGLNPLVHKPLSVCVVLFEGFSLTCLSVVAEALRVANYLAGFDLYKVSVVSQHGGKVSSGANPISTRPYDAISAVKPNLIILCDEEDVEPSDCEADLDSVRWLKEMAKQQASICAIGAAVFKLAKYGMLNEQRVAVPWHHLDEFEARFPHLQTCGTLMELAHPTMTCAGGIATLDFMLHCIAQTSGLSLAARVSDYMVYEGIREPRAFQRPLSTSFRKVADKRVAEVLSIVEKDPLSRPGDIARKLTISTRQLERVCSKNLKCTPTQLLQFVRLERSRTLLRLSDKPVLEIALECGFISGSHFSHCYKAHFGHSPRRDRVGPVRPSGMKQALLTGHQAYVPFHLAR